MHTENNGYLQNERVFIVGLPRTGSTLLRTVLNRSERVSITAETHYLSQWSRIGKNKRITRFGDLQQDKNVDAFLDDIYNSRVAAGKDFWAWMNKNVDRAAFRSRLLGTDRSDKAIFEALMQVSAQTKRGPIQPGWILGEKTSANIYHLPTLFEWYPRSKVIHTFRDPRGIFVSSATLVRNGKWGVKKRIPGLPNQVVNPVLDSIMAVYISQLWLDAVRLHRRYEKQYPSKYMLVRFEDFIHDPEQHIRRVCDFLNIPFEPVMVSDVTIVGSSYQSQRIVPGGFDPTAGERWKDHINPLASAWFSFLGRKHLKQLGYLAEGSTR